MILNVIQVQVKEHNAFSNEKSTGLPIRGCIFADKRMDSDLNQVFIVLSESLEACGSVSRGPEEEKSTF